MLRSWLLHRAVEAGSARLNTPLAADGHLHNVHAGIAVDRSKSQFYDVNDGIAQRNRRHAT
jgi:hypothetical protein